LGASNAQLNCRQDNGSENSGLSRMAGLSRLLTTGDFVGVGVARQVHAHALSVSQMGNASLMRVYIGLGRRRTGICGA